MGQRAKRAEVEKILRDADERLRAAENSLEAAAKERVAAYRFAAENGFTRAEIAKVAGITRQRADQIIRGG